MRIVGIIVAAAAVVACGGISDAIDSGGKDGGNESEPFICNGQNCDHYCIHPSTVVCPTCTALPDGGACPPGSQLQNDCPAGPAMPPGQYCVTYPSPDPPFCSDTIPSDCWDPSPASEGTYGDVTCSPLACGA